MIKTKCLECGKALEAPEEAAGGKGKCPECGAVFEIPPAREEKKCPACGSVYPDDAVICTKCGINLSTGEKIIPEAAAGVARSGKLRLAGEGSLYGAAAGAVVLVVFMLVEAFVKSLMGGDPVAGGDLPRMLLFWAAAGGVFGVAIGIVTVMTRSEKAGTLLGLALLGAAVFYVFLKSPLAGLFMLIGSLFWGYIVYLASGAVAGTVMKLVGWEKYE